MERAGRRGRRGRPPMGARGRGRLYREVWEHLAIFVSEGKEVVSFIENFVLLNGYAYVSVYGATGILSEMTIQDQGDPIDAIAGYYQIEDLKGIWREEDRPNRLVVNVHARDLSDGRRIHGDYQYLVAANHVMVYMDALRIVPRAGR